MTYVWLLTGRPIHRDKESCVAYALFACCVTSHLLLLLLTSLQLLGNRLLSVLRPMDRALVTHVETTNRHDACNFLPVGFDSGSG